jgi:hypothetical protein
MNWQFKAGDCFEFDFLPIDAYKNGEYLPVPGDLDVCSFNVKAKCERRSGLGFKVTINEDVPMDLDGISMLSGRVGKLKNPYSTQTLTISGIRYYYGCNNPIPTDIAKTSIFGSGATTTTFDIFFDQGTITDQTIETSSKVVGFSG